MLFPLRGTIVMNLTGVPSAASDVSLAAAVSEDPEPADPSADPEAEVELLLPPPPQPATRAAKRTTKTPNPNRRMAPGQRLISILSSRPPRPSEAAGHHLTQLVG